MRVEKVVKIVSTNVKKSRIYEPHYVINVNRGSEEIDKKI